MLQRSTAPTETGTAPTGAPVAAAPSWRDKLTRLATRAYGRLDHSDRAALGIWLLAHIPLFILAYAAAWALAPDKAHMPLTGQYEHLDAPMLRAIAQYGYFGGPGGKPTHPAQIVFLPGFPAALAAVHLAVRNWIASELLVSLIAGGVAVVALTRLAGTSRAALYLLTAPAAVFLTVGYSESLFLAFALPAWLAATRDQWEWAGVLGFFAAATRIDGLFLIPALAMMALLSGRGRWRALLSLAPAALAPVLYEAYLYTATRRWSAWMDANQAGWGIHLTTPWKSLKTTYWGAFQHPGGAQWALSVQWEIASEFVGLLLAVVLLARRMWPEAVYVALTFIALGVSTWYATVPRSLLLAFPLYVLLARSRHRWVGILWLVVCGPLAVLWAVEYLGGGWVA